MYKTIRYWPKKVFGDYQRFVYDNDGNKLEVDDDRAEYACVINGYVVPCQEGGYIDRPNPKYVPPQQAYNPRDVKPRRIPGLSDAMSEILAKAADQQNKRG
jgi:hypothetical protein